MKRRINETELTVARSLTVGKLFLKALLLTFKRLTSVNSFYNWQIAFALICLLAYPLSINAQNAYPTPPDKYGRLFYIQRTGNANTIVYDANFSGVKIFNSNNPINVYWIRYAEKGDVKPLNYLQRTFAYGVSIIKGTKPNEFDFNLVSYAKKKLKLMIDAYGNPYAQIEVNGKTIKLHHIFVKIDQGTLFTMAPKVNYVEIFGKDPKSGAAIYEKIIP